MEKNSKKKSANAESNNKKENPTAENKTKKKSTSSKKEKARKQKNDGAAAKVQVDGGNKKSVENNGESESDTVYGKDAADKNIKTDDVDKAAAADESNIASPMETSADKAQSAFYADTASKEIYKPVNHSDRSMTASKAKAKNNDNVHAAIGIIVTLAVLALFAWLLFTVFRPNALGQIEAMGESVRGHEQQFTCYVKDGMLNDGEKVIWKVNGRQVAETTYDSSAPLTLNYTPTLTGYNSVSVKAGKYRQFANVTVKAPKLSLKAPDITITYGDELPEINYECVGFVDNDNAEKMCYDGNCRVINGDVLNAGVYTIEFDKPCSYKDYDVEYVTGTLTVLPRKLSVTNNFEKVYDRTNVINDATLNLDGKLEGDEVSAKFDRLYFDDKNAGVNKTITLANVELIGKDSGNYVLEKETHGKITPKTISLTGLTVKSKSYDGTARATLDTVGKLNGVLSGDSVAVGKVDVSFDEAYIGERSVIVENVTLIGLDKDNYKLDEIQTENGMITY